jgi:hypothetical protein
LNYDDEIYPSERLLHEFEEHMGVPKFDIERWEDHLKKAVAKTPGPSEIELPEFEHLIELAEKGLSPYETKKQKFCRLAKGRTKNVLRHIEFIKHCFKLLKNLNRHTYEIDNKVASTYIAELKKAAPNMLELLFELEEAWGQHEPDNSHHEAHCCRKT